MQKVSIIIGADFVPTESNKKMFTDGDINEIFGYELVELIKKNDIKIFNLETPLIKEKSPIKKCGSNLGITPDVMNAIEKLEPTYLNIVNNHIMDHGLKGLNSTISILEKKKIGYSGYGLSEDKINKFWTHKVNNITIGIYSCVEHEFSVATKEKPGVLAYDDIKSFDDVKIYSQKCDFMIILYHGGKEYYQYPSPKLKERCEKFIDSGADIVICQHSHCIGCEEEYNNKKIIYGQGNFIFDDGTINDLWENGFLIKFDIEEKNIATNYEYYVLEKEENKVRLASKKNAKEILEKYFKRSSEIQAAEKIYKKYNDYAKKELYTILRKYDWFSSTLVMRILNKLTRGIIGRIYFEKIYLPKKACDLLNGVECECWSEVTITLLKNYIER